MVNDIYSKTKDTLSPQKALEKARFFLDIAATTDDPVIKLMLSGNVGSILSKIEKSARKALVSSPTVDAQVLCDGIIAAFTKNGTLFSELGHQSDAKASFKSADKWQYDHSISHAASSSTPLKRKQARTDEAVLPPEIFPQDVPRPVLKHDLPKPDGRLVNTPQLAYCLGLLSMAQTFSPSDPEFDEPLDGTQRAWVDATLKNEDEQERLRSLVTKLMEAFINNGLKDDATVAEVMCLAPILEQGQYRNLLDTLVGGIKQSTVLDFSLLEGLILMIQSASPGYLRTEDLVKILSILGSRLEGTHHQSTEYLYQLAKAMSSVLDAMADSGVKDVNREELHAPLTAYLEELNSCSDLSLKYQAAYACQALQHVPDDEKLWQSALRRTRVVVSGVSKMATAVKNVELERFIEGLKNIHEGFEGAYKAAKTTGKTVASVVGLFESRHGLVGNLREGFPFSRKQTWYTALRGADTLLGDGQLREFRNLICRSPCRQEPEFVWGLSQRLGEIATNSLWDDNTRQQAIEFLSELYTNDTEWGQQPEVKQWILTILIQISILQDAVVQNQAHIVLQNLKTNGDAKRRALYQDSINHLPTPYKIKICLPLPSSPTLLDHVQDIPDIEADLRKLRARQLSGRGKTVYIPPQSKASPQALDESRFPLMEKVLDFLKSDRQVLLIQGDSGAGKSTFNRKLECDLWESYRKADGRIPLHIHLPEIKESNQDLITKHLRRTDFTERQIRELKCRREFILICDGYDESQQSHNLYTSNRLNEPGQWRVKMIISCRSEYLEQNYYDRFQPTDRNHRGLSTLFQEAVILPFSAEQIEDYIKQYVCQNQLQWTTDSYMEVLRMVPSLMDLVKNPFLLSLSLETLPSFVDENQIKDLSGANITRVGLYDKFVEQWLERGKKRRMEMDLNPQTKAIFDTLVDEGFAKTGIDFIKRLAAAMFKEQGGHPVVDYSRSQDKGTWKAEFFSREDESQILREASPLARSGNQFRFLHKSVLEYCFTLSIFDPRDSNSPPPTMTTDRRGSISSTCSFEDDSRSESISMSIQQSIVKNPLSWRSIVSEPSILQFLVERVQQEPLFKQQLLGMIEFSKTDKRACKAAANAITILVRANVPFNGADLKGIQIPGADLSGGEFDSANLQWADLRNVVLRNAWLRQADLSNAWMHGVQFGEWPYLQEHAWISSCRYSADGKTLVVGLDDGSRLYDTATWTKNFCSSESDNDASSSAVGSHGSVSSMVYSPNGRQVASSSHDGTVRLCDAQCYASGSLSSDLYDMDAYKAHLQGKRQSNSHVVDTQSPTPCSILKGHSRGVTSLAYSPCGEQVASGSRDMTVRLWDTRTGAPGLVLIGHSDDISCVTYSPCGQRIASGSRDMTVRIWDPKTGTNNLTLCGHTGGVSSVAYSPSGQQIASGSQDSTVRLWDTQTAAFDLNPKIRTGDNSSLAYSPCSQQIASGDNNGMVRLWDPLTNAPGFSVSCHSGCVSSIVFSPNGQQIASGGRDETVRLWNALAGTPHLVLSGHTERVTCLAYSSNGRQIASGSDDMTVRVWDAQTGTCGPVLNGHEGGVTSIAYSPKGGQQIASGSNDQTVRLWDAQAGTLILTLTGHVQSVASVTYSPSGQQIASGSRDKTVRFWNPQTGTADFIIQDHKEEINSVAYSPNGQQIASGGNKTVRIWEVDSGQCLAVVQSFQGAITSIIWSVTRELTHFITCSRDGSVCNWKILKDIGQYQVRLQWSSPHDRLILSEAMIHGVQGLSVVNRKLMEQRGAL